MKANLLWPVAVIVALLTGLWWQSDSTPAPATTTKAVDNSAEVAALRARIDGLEEKVAELEAAPPARRAEVAAARQPARRAVAVDAVEVAGDAPAVPREAVVEAITGNDRTVRKHLRKMIASERDAEREARWERRQERAAERSRQMIADLADAADLSDDEQETVQTKLDEERTVIMGLFRAAREDGSWREAHREARDVRSATDEAMKASLEPKQYQQYQALRDEDGWGRRGRH